MTFNEINNLIDTDNPFNAWTGAGVLYEDNENIEQTMYQISHYQFVASARAVQRAKEINAIYASRLHVAFWPNLSFFL